MAIGWQHLEWQPRDPQAMVAPWMVQINQSIGYHDKWPLAPKTELPLLSLRKEGWRPLIRMIFIFFSFFVSEEFFLFQQFQFRWAKWTMEIKDDKRNEQLCAHKTLERAIQIASRELYLVFYMLYLTSSRIVQIEFKLLSSTLRSSFFCFYCFSIVCSIFSPLWVAFFVLG